MRATVIIDILMVALLIAAFAYPFTGTRVHGVNGIILSTLFIIHNVLNGRWYSALIKGRYSFRRTLGTIINIALLTAMLATVAFGVLMSNLGLSIFGTDFGASFSRFHITSAVWTFVLISIHLGMHWGTLLNLARRGRKGVGPSRIGERVVCFLLTLLIALNGFRAALHRNIGPKLVLYYSFDFARTGDSIVVFILDHLSIMGLCVGVVHYALKFAAGKKK